MIANGKLFFIILRIYPKIAKKLDSFSHFLLIFLPF